MAKERRPGTNGVPATIALVAGATAGHLSPALAVAEGFRQLAPEVECLLVVPRSAAGSWVLEGAGLSVETIDARPFYGESWPRRMALPVHVAASALAVRRQLRARGVSLVVAFGGFGCLDAALAAWALGIPVFVHEANARGGLSTRLVAHLADRVFLGVEAAAPDFPFGRTTATGTPVRAAFFDVPERRRARRREHPGPSRVLVMGGSLGSAFLDRRFPATAARLASLGTRLHVTHLGGGGDMGAIEGAYRAANVPAAVQPPLRDMASALTDCDFVVSRAGASSLAEIAASGTPALFVPLPKHAREHQRANLLAAQRRAPVWWLPEEGWNDGEVAEALASRLGDTRGLAEAGEAMRILAAPDCACRIVEACLARLARGAA